MQGGLGRFALRNGTWPNPPSTFCSPLLSHCAPFSCLNARNRLLLMKIRPVSVILRWGLLPWRSTLLPIGVDNDLLRSERRNTESQMLQRKKAWVVRCFYLHPISMSRCLFQQNSKQNIKNRRHMMSHGPRIPTSTPLSIPDFWKGFLGLLPWDYLQFALTPLMRSCIVVTAAILVH